MSLEFTLAYLAAGVLAGFLGGLLGVGGGVVIVPILLFLFGAQHFSPDYMMHMAVATSLASIMFTSLASLRAHHSHSAVRWDIVMQITPGILAGALAGTFLVARLPSDWLKNFFVVFIFYVATQLLFNIGPHAKRQIPGIAGMFATGGLIGLVSSFVGIGGGTLSVPFMTSCNVKMHDAIGTSAAIGFPIAFAGALGYLLNGLSAENLPYGSLGYIHLPALGGIVISSMLIAPLGARAAHTLPVKKLKKYFALFLYIIAVSLLLKSLQD